MRIASVACAAVLACLSLGFIALWCAGDAIENEETARDVSPREQAYDVAAHIGIPRSAALPVAIVAGIVAIGLGWRTRASR